MRFAMLMPLLLLGCSLGAPAAAQAQTAPSQTTPTPPLSLDALTEITPQSQQAERGLLAPMPTPAPAPQPSITPTASPVPPAWEPSLSPAMPPPPEPLAAIPAAAAPAVATPAVATPAPAPIPMRGYNGLALELPPPPLTSPTPMSPNPLAPQEPTPTPALPPLTAAPAASPLIEPAATPNTATTDPDFQFLPLLPPKTALVATPLLWPLVATQALGGTHDRIQRVVIVLHDTDRGAAQFLRDTATLAGSVAVGANAQTLLIAPLFPSRADQVILRTRLAAASDHLALWDQAAWWQGGDSLTGDGMQPAAGISSMTALDLLLMLLADKQLFPALNQIILAGYGRGGDLAQRYMLYGKAPDILAEQRLPLRSVVMAAQSYVYLTADRPEPTPTAAACPNSQAYPYGLEQPNPYTQRLAGNVARQLFPSRDIVYVVSAKDTTPATDQTCAALRQGKSVKARATHYAAHLAASFGDTLRQRLVLPPNTTPDALSLLASPCGTSLLLADGAACASAPPAP
jgi:hypothetical protein